jgi:hypothetical protein
MIDFTVHFFEMVKAVRFIDWINKPHGNSGLVNRFGCLSNSFGKWICPIKSGQSQHFDKVQSVVDVFFYEKGMWY